MQLQRLRLVLSSSLRSLTSLPKPGAFLLNPITKYQQRKSAFTRHQVHEDGRVTHQDGTAVSALAESVHLATRLAGAFVSEPPNSGQIAVDLTNQLYSLERIEEKIRRRSSTEYIEQTIRHHYYWDATKEEVLRCLATVCNDLDIICASGLISRVDNRLCHEEVDKSVKRFDKIVKRRRTM